MADGMTRMDKLRLFMRYTERKDYLMLMAAFLFVVVQVYMDITIPGYMSEIVELLYTPGTVPSDILGTGGWMLLCALCSLMAALVTGFIAAKVAATVAMRLREAIFRKTLALWVRALHWFNPLVWLTARAMDRDIELSCDESALKHLPPADHAAYGRTILSAVSALTGAGRPQSASISDSEI